MRDGYKNIVRALLITNPYRLKKKFQFWVLKKKKKYYITLTLKRQMWFDDIQKGGNEGVK